MKRPLAALAALGIVSACGGAGSHSGFDLDGGGPLPDGGGGSGDTGTILNHGDSGMIHLGGGDGSAEGGSPKSCTYMDATDHDGDGWSFMDGDCNDCDPDINPGAYDIPMDGIDEDCNGVPDDEPTGCDATVALASNDPMDGAKAIDICRQTSNAAVGKAKTWGVVDAQYVLPDGTTTSNPHFSLGYGLLSGFGVNHPQGGSHLLALSSGTARGPSDPGWKNPTGFAKGYVSGSPPPYPKASSTCPGVVAGKPHDGVALQLTIRVPTNAKAFTFNQNFFTFEFPDYICSVYNDAYVVMMTPKVASLPDDNIAFDSAGDPISVNSGLLQVCIPQTAGGKAFACPLGDATLKGTGFDEAGALNDDGPHAATGWLTTTAPVETVKGQNITLLFAVWDSTDGILDTTVLVDNFQWSFTPPSGMGPTTTPTPAPK